MSFSMKLLTFVLTLFFIVPIAKAQTPHEELQTVLAEIDAAGASTAADAQAKLRDARNKLNLLSPKFRLQEQDEDSGSFVLRDDWFVGKFDKQYVDKLTIRDTQLFLGAAVVIADGMLTVAKKDLPNSTAYLDEWRTEERLVLDRLEKLPLTKDSVKIYDAFLTEWRDEVKRVANDRFQDALTQAAYSILRVAEGVEKQHVDNVRKRIAAGPARSSSSTNSQTGVSGGSYPFHERMMSHIYRKHDRQANRVERVIARR